MARFSFAQPTTGATPKPPGPGISSLMSTNSSGSTTGEGMAVLLAVVVEVGILVALRHTFRKHHGG